MHAHLPSKKDREKDKKEGEGRREEGREKSKGGRREGKERRGEVRVILSVSFFVLLTGRKWLVFYAMTLWNKFIQLLIHYLPRCLYKPH